MMKKIGSVFLFSLVLFATVPLVNASIVDWSCAPDGDGAIVMDYTTLTFDNGEYLLDMDGAQYWYPAHLEGDFTTDTQLDPTVRILQDIENDTTFAWTDYHIDIGMSNTFSILSTGLTAPTGWTWVITAPVAGQMPNNSGLGYVGTIDFYQGTGAPVGIGDFGEFGFKVSFLGSIAFSTEQIPTPEPATIALLGLGAISLFRKRKS